MNECRSAFCFHVMQAEAAALPSASKNQGLLCGHTRAPLRGAIAGQRERFSLSETVRRVAIRINRPENICRFLDAFFLLRCRRLFCRAVRKPLEIPSPASERLSTAVSTNRKDKKSSDQRSRTSHWDRSYHFVIALCRAKKSECAA